MPLEPRTRLGPYEIVARLGAGGMGEVYRARDPKLNRDVALKVLPELFAHDPERLARFKREAQVLASLNHPKIAAIYGFEESNGVQALVLELVEGPTLADRLTDAPIPIEEALPIARQIAEALEAAHVQGIVHRDLKPANLKVRPDGAVKVLDFGLAKALAPELAAVAPHDLSRSPTVTTPAATRIGVIMGTAPYMSPEQARGQTAGTQADIWAFGVLLYEMLTGKQAFTGDTITDVLADIVKIDPDWRALPENTPLPIRLLLRHCLQKSPASRLHHIADARIEIDAASIDSSVTTAPAPHGSAVRRRVLAGVVAAGLLLAGGGATLLVERYIRPEPVSLGVVRLAVTAPEKTTFFGGPNTPYTSVSPDGRRVAFLAASEGVLRIWVRSLDTLEARPLVGTEGVVPYPPFWSPDSRSIGFFTGAGKLRKIEMSGGPAQTICDAPLGINPSGTWNREGVIVFGGGSEPLKRVSAAGGTPQPVTVLDQSRQDQGHHWPTFLPDGNHFFFLVRAAAAENSAILIGRLSSWETTRVVSADSRIAYDPSGYLLFVRERSLLALPFDAKTLRPAGDPVVIAEQVRANAVGQSSVTVSGNGVLAYRTGDVERSTLTWFDRAGKILGTVGPAGSYQSPQLSPDETRVAVVRTDSEGGRDVWVIDTARASMTRLTFGAGSLGAVWSPDGERISFKRSEGDAVYVMPSVVPERRRFSSSQAGRCRTGPPMATR